MTRIYTSSAVACATLVHWTGELSECATGGNQNIENIDVSREPPISSNRQIFYTGDFS